MQIYDNGGETFDRYTLVTEAGDIFTMSQNPLSPDGFNQYSHTLEEGEKYVIKDEEWKIAITTAPPTVLAAIIKRLESSYAAAVEES